ncbi:hypothetical protein DPMN_168156 [Dreissena polymorpha]|uniref:Uncharacterized protein n=1 Tax=Dreissena polymorpha TaxID=45954 RepID=A0A9D4IZ15_DREPO|nr:hypothetical protein DPMN_168156 [Dreissena polymorpha]
MPSGYSATLVWGTVVILSLTSISPSSCDGDFNELVQYDADDVRQFLFGGKSGDGSLILPPPGHQLVGTSGTGGRSHGSPEDMSLAVQDRKQMHFNAHTGKERSHMSGTDFVYMFLIISTIRKSYSNPEITITRLAYCIIM